WNCVATPSWQIKSKRGHYVFVITKSDQPEEKTVMKNQEKGWNYLLAAVAAFAVLAGTATARAEDTRLYAFSSGALTIGKGVLQNFAAMDPPIVIPVGFYVIKHPKGNVLFD